MNNIHSQILIICSLSSNPLISSYNGYTELVQGSGLETSSFKKTTEEASDDYILLPIILRKTALYSEHSYTAPAANFLITR